MFIQQYEYYNKSHDFESPKLVVKGEVLTMDQWNITTEDVNPNFNIISREKENWTTYFYNLTIFNELTSSIEKYIFESDIISRFNISIGCTIEIYDYHPFIEIKVFNE